MKKEKILKFCSILIIGLLTFLIGFTKLNAATASISVRSSSSTVIVGKTFTVTVTVSSSAALGSWEYTIDYNSSLFKLISGQSYVADYGNGTKKSASYTYSFKALASGTGRISVRSYEVYDWSEKKMSVTPGSASVKTMTQSQLESTYSKNNYLKSLSVEGNSISPKFNKDTLEYTVNLPTNTESIKVKAYEEDSKASVRGTGTIDVSEGDNKIEIEVTAENGSTRTYTLTAKVVDANPITVTTIDGKTMTVVKRESLLTTPETFGKITATIEDIKVPAFYSEITKYTLVGLKDEEGNISLYIYDKDNDIYKPYTVVNLNQIKLSPLNVVDDNKFESYILTKIKINGIELSAYKIKDNSDFSIIYTVNIETGEKDYYFYDSKLNSAVRYNSEEIDLLNNKVDKYFKLIIALSIESIVLLVAFIMTIVSHKKSNKNILLKNEKRIKRRN